MSNLKTGKAYIRALPPNERIVIMRFIRRAGLWTMLHYWWSTRRLSQKTFDFAEYIYDPMGPLSEARD